MFGVEMASLAVAEPARWARLRAQAKTINFGIVYGQRGRALARSLSQSGVETTEEEGRRLLEAWLAAHPRVAAWVGERDAFIEAMARDPGPVDWTATLRLHRWFRRALDVRHEFRRLERRWPTAAEVAERIEEIDVTEAAWILRHEAAVVLRPGGGRLVFASTTPAGRRQQFDVPTERVLLGAVVAAAQSSDPDLVAVRRTMTERTGTALSAGSGPRDTAGLEKLFEDRTLRRAYADEIAARCGQATLDALLAAALRDRLGSLSNAYRNAPIQGGVADVMLAAYGMLPQQLDAVSGVVPVQTVHDSVVVECPAEHGVEVAQILKATLEDAMATMCPDVPARADADVRASLSDADVVLTV
jgi:hypothetical protein